MKPIKFGAFLAPHHPIGENPTLQYRRDLDLVEQLDRSVGYDSPVETFDNLTQAGGVLIGTPDDLVREIRDMYELSGGFGTVVGFVNDFAHPEAISRSWDMVARYVLPEVHGMLDDFRESQTFVQEHREYFDRAGQAIMAKINENDRAADALLEEATSASAISAHTDHAGAES